jgi:C1A family cysteine protease
MKNTCLIAIALLTRLALPASSRAQEKCKWETVEVTANTERNARLEELQHEMKPEFTFTIGDTGVLTHRELTGAKPPDAASLRRQMERQHELAKQAGVTELTKKPLPAVFDWLKQGKVSSVKCQWCEDCWAFAVAGVIESSLMIHENPSTEPNISEQAIVDCSKAGTCKDGGWWDRALDYARRNSLPDEEHYPYTHDDSSCKIVNGPRYGVKIWDYVETDGGDPTIEALKRAVLDHGPIVAGIVSTDLFDAYTSGVFNELPNSTDCINHGIVIIGWDDSKHAWHIKNSWGKCGRRCWGEEGFGWVAYRANHIGYAAAWAEAKKV